MASELLINVVINVLRQCFVLSTSRFWFCSFPGAAISASLKCVCNNVFFEVLCKYIDENILYIEMWFLCKEAIL